MKAIIMKKISGKYLVLTEEGSYVKTRLNGNPRTGSEFEIPAKSGSRYRLLVPVIAAVSVFMLAVGAYAYAMPVSYVTVDINPSVELSLNRVEYVIKAKALNDGGLSILQHGELLNRPLKAALSNLVVNARIEGYALEENEDGMLLTVFSGNESTNRKILKLFEESQDEFSQSGKGIGIIIAASNLERFEEAKELGISPGKLNLINKIEIEGDIDLDPAEYMDLSVKEIVALGKMINQGKQKSNGIETDDNGQSKQPGNENNNKGKSDSAPGQNKGN